MKPSRKISLHQLIFSILAILAMVIILTIGCLVTAREYFEFKIESKQLRNEYISTQKDLLKNEVNRIVGFIEYDRSNTEKRLKDSIKERVLEAHAIAANLHAEHAGKKSEDDIKKIILDALRPIRFNNGRGYYFATDLNGIEILFADHPELEGKDLIDMQDTKGAYVIRDMIDIVKKNGEGFYQYNWTKPNVSGRSFPKIAYLKYFEPFNGFIGTGEYLDDVECDIQREALERIGKIRLGKDGYIFVDSYDGMTLTNVNHPENIGKNQWDLEDINGVKIIQEERKAADKPDGDFIQYVWERPSTGESAPKLSYVKGFPQWQWMVGAGVYIDDIESVIVQKEADAWQQAKKETYIFGSVVCVFFLLILLLSSFAAGYFKKGFDAFLSFFKDMETGGTPITTEHLPLKEFDSLADSANRMLIIRKQAEKDLKESERKFRFLTEKINDVVWTLDLNLNTTFVSPSITKILGFTPQERMAQKFQEQVTPESYAKIIGIFTRELELEKKGDTDPDRAVRLEVELYHKNGTTMWTEIVCSGIRGTQGALIGIHGVSRDISERKRAEKEREEMQQQLIQSQRLESVGRLAGGVAHDFNNMLSVIIGYSEMALDQIDPSDQLHMDMQEVLSSARRSADLTRQLLAFARRQTLSMEPLDINSVINNFMKMLKRTLRENIVIETHLAPSLGIIAGDIGQIEQVIINLAINAQDAMLDGGKLIIETSDAQLDEDDARSRPGIVAGLYVLMTVSDTGIGMDSDTIEKIFEPFFTTKEMSRGSGLGMAAVYGIVKQHGGNIWVYSEPGKGTTFHVYFPHRSSEAHSTPKTAAAMKPAHGTETILLAEDQTEVRAMAVRILKPLGYTVIEASDGQTAVDLMKKHQGEIDLLLTDVIMPDMNGKELYQRLCTLQPGLKVIYTSGYTADVIGHHGVMVDDVQFIQKPFSIRDFSGKVREVLDGE